MNTLRIVFASLIACCALISANAQACKATFKATIGCNTVSFTPDDVTLKYKWEFGDGEMSTETSPTHIYSKAIGNGTQSFTVKLTVSGGSCNEASSTQMITVQQAPDATILDASNTGFIKCSSNTLSIKNASTTAITNTKYEIDWGDKSTLFTTTTLNSDIDHDYAKKDQYNLTLTVTGNNGCKSTKNYNVFIGTRPSIGLAISGEASECAPYSATFDILKTTTNVPGTLYLIKVNDGSDSVLYNHPSPLTYTHLFNKSSCKTTSQQGTTIYNNSFQVIIIARNACGQSSGAVVPVNINIPPKADFTIGPDSINCEKVNVDFINTSERGEFYVSETAVNCSDSITSRWTVMPNTGFSIVKGSLSSNQGFSAQFEKAGTYKIRLIVSHYDNKTCAPDTIEKTVCIVPIPKAKFKKDNAFGCYPLTVKLGNESNTLGSCDNSTTYRWRVVFRGSECGKNGKFSFITPLDSTSQNGPTIRFDSTGVYLVSLVVKNRCGTNTYTDSITVASPGASSIQPISDFCDRASFQPNIEVRTSCFNTPTYEWSFPGGMPASATGIMPGIINYNTSGNYTITLKTTNTCGVTTTTRSFRVFKSPDVPQITTNSPICVGRTLTFTVKDTVGLRFAWTGPNGFVSNLPNPQIPNVQLNASGDYNLLVTDRMSGCTTMTKVNVSVYNLPPVRIQPDKPEVCVGKSVTLTVSGAQTYSWSPSTNINTTTGPTVIVTPTSSATLRYIVTGTDVNGCFNKDTVDVIANPLPNVDAGKDQELCNQPIPLTLMPTPSGGKWTGATQVTEAGVFTPSSLGTFKLRYTYTDPATGCTNFDTMTIRVIAPEQLTLPNDTVVCINTPALNFIAQPTGGTWSNREGLITAAGVFTPSQSGKFVVVHSRGAETCLRKDSMIVTVNALPNPSITPVKNPICFGDSTTLTATGGDKYLWSPATGLSASNRAVVKAGPATSTLYTVTVTDVNGCVDTAQLNLRVAPLPLVNAGTDQEFCNQPIPLTLMPTPSGGKWTGAAQVTEAGVFTPSGLGTFKLRYTYTDPATGCTNFDTMTIRVIAPEQLTLPNDTVVCINTPALNFIAQPAGGTWSNREGHITAAGVFTPAQAGKFVAVYSRGANTCIRKDSVTITVNALPVVTITPVKNPICFGDSTTLTAAGGTIYQWGPATGLSASNKAVVKAGPATSTLYTVTVTDMNGCVDTAQLNLRVTPLPVVDAGADQEFCNQPLPVTLKPTPEGGKWSGATQVSEAGIFTPSGLGTFNLRYTYTNPATGCTNFDTMTIRVIAPEQLNLPNDTVVCINTPALNLVAQPSGGTWSNREGLINPAGVFTPAQAGKFVAVYSRGANTCLRKDSVTITVNALPVVTITPVKNPICFGDSTTLTAAGGDKYLWGPATGLSASNKAVVKAGPATSTLYTVTVTDMNGCVDTAQINLKVTPLPVVDAGADQEFCNQPVPVTLMPTPTGGKWSGATQVSEAGIFTPSGLGTFKLLYTYTNPATGCINFDTMTIRVIAPEQLTLPNDTVVCINTQALNLVAQPSGGTWSNREGLINPAGVFTPSQAGKFVAVYSRGANTCIRKDSVTITVNALPVVTITPLKNPICFGDSTTLTAAGGTIYQWGPATGLSASNKAVVKAGPATSTLYTVTVTDLNGCVDTAQINLKVTPLPVVDAGADQEFCNQPVPVTLMPTPTGGKWSGATQVSEAGIFTPSGLGTFKLLYTYTDPATGCTSFDTMTIRVIAPDTLTLPKDTAVCINTPALNFIAKPDGGKWSGNPALISEAGVFTPAQAGKFVVVYARGDGTCLRQGSVTITVNALPVVTITPVKNPICFGDSTTLTAAGGTIYQWGPATGLSAIDKAIVKASPATSTLYTVTVTDQNGCVDTAQLDLKVTPLPVVDAGADQEFCNQPIPVTLMPMPTGGKWSGATQVSEAGIFTPSGLGTFKLLYTYTDPATGCTSFDTMTIRVIAPDSLILPKDTAVCINTPALNFIAKPDGGKWSGNPALITEAGVFTPAQAGKFVVVYARGDGTCLRKDSVTITVNPLPIIILSAATNPICFGDSTTLTAAGGDNFRWSPTTGLSDSTKAVFKAGPATSTLYTVTVTDMNGCVGTAQLDLRVTPLPVVDAGADLEFCNQPIPVTLMPMPTGGKWSGATQVTEAGVFTPSGLGTFKLLYTYTDPTTGCTSFDTMTIRVIAPDTLTLPKDTAVCINTPALNLIAKPDGGKWSGNPALISEAGVFTPAQAGKFVVVYARGDGTCLRQDSITITVNPLPTPVIIADKNPICFGDTSNLNASGGIFYQWSPSTGLSAIDRIQLKANPRVTTTYTVTVTDQNTCVNTSEIILVVNPLPIVNAGNDTSYCINPNPILLAPATPSGGRWSGSGIVDPEQGTFNSAQVGVGRWPLIYTFEDANQCVNQDTVSISVVEPVIPEAGLNDTVCVYDAPFMLKGFSPSNLDGRWSGRGITDARAALFSPAAAGVGVHTLIFTVGQGSCAYSDSIQMVVADYPEVEAGQDLERCIDAPAVQLSGFSPLGGSWRGRGVDTQGLLQPNQAGVGSQFLVYTYQDPVTRCINKDSIKATINPLPIVSAGRDTSYCDNPNPEDILLHTATPAGGTWSGPGIVDPSKGIFRTDRAGGRGTYTLVYTFIDPKGCEDADSIIVTVIDPVLAQVRPRDTLCFSDGLDTLVGLPVGGTWSGAGIVDRTLGIFDPKVAARVRKDGRYTTYSLIYNFGAGTCETKDTLQMLVVNMEGEVEAGKDFTVCSSEPALNLSTGLPKGGYWEGQGITNSTNGTFIAKEAGIGKHVLYYFYRDPISGCLGFDSLLATVNPIPQASFAELEEACISKPVEFKNTTTGALTYFWDFGDGKTSTERNPIHRYVTTGEFTIRLIATTEFGCIDSAKQTIFVTEPPMAAFAQDKNKGCGRELCVNFRNQSTGYKVSYFWDFGNGDTTSMAQPPQICFKQSNYQDTTYFVQLNVTNLCGTVYDIDSVIVQPVPRAIFAVDRDQDCSPFKVQLANRSIGNPKTYLWDFGPGIPLSTDSLPEAPTYTTDTTDRVVPIKLIARNTCGVDTFVLNIRVLPNNLRAFFNTEPIVGCQPLEVNFTSFSTGANLVHNWTFGDGNASTLMSPIHTYDTSGVFKVILKIDNGCGFDKAQAMVRVNPAPKVVYTHAPTVCAKDSLVFNNVSPNTLGAVWDFGDGQTSNLRNPKHVYADSGTYTIKLTVFAETTGCPATDSSIVRVLPNPKPGFRHPKDGCVPLTIALINTSSNGKYYWWDFGDDNTSTEREPKHEYLAAGRYTIALAVSDSLGCTGDTLRSEILIHPKPKSAFVPLIDKVCGLPLQVNFRNTSEGASGFEWNFGNGSSSKLREPSTSYKDSGLYTIRLIVSNPFTCKDTSFQKVRALGTPLADFEIDPPVGCQPFRPSITNLSMGANQAFWRSSNGQISREFTPKFFYPNPGVYTVILVTGAYGLCFDTLTIDSAITVKPSPNAGFRYLESNTEPPDGTVIFTNESSLDAIKFKWDFGDGEASELKDVTHRYFQNAAVTVALVAENAFACIDTAIKTINFRFIKGLFVPNAFTPETGPEEVRVFLPSGVGLRRYKLSIYSRWGQLLWESTALTPEGRPKEGWDGYFNGSLMPQDVYVWKVEAEFDDDSLWKGSPDRKKRIRTSGTVHLLR